jgi:hypothetical protein
MEYLPQVTKESSMKQNKTTDTQRNAASSKEEGQKRAAEFYKLAKIFESAGNIAYAEECRECAYVEELVSDLGPIAGLYMNIRVRA